MDILNYIMDNALILIPVLLCMGIRLSSSYIRANRQTNPRRA